MNTDRSFGVFAFLVAFATLCYHAQMSLPPADLGFGRMALAAAFVTMARPRWLVPFVALVVLQTLSVVAQMPAVSTNRLLQGFVGVTIILALVQLLAARLRTPSQRRTPLTGPVLLDAARAPLQMVLGVVYFWAVIDKLNHGYFDPAQSCAVNLATALPFVHSIPAAARLPLIWSSLLLEASILPLLLVARLRLWGVRLGVAFHGILGVAGFYSFSATMVALLSLFVSPEEFETFARRVDGWRRHPALLAVTGTLIVGGVLALWRYNDPHPLDRTMFWNAALALGQNLNLLRVNFGIHAVFGLWLILMAPILALLWRLGSPHARAAIADARLRRAGGPSPRAWLALAVPALVFINGATPYLGWKTETAFAMYSNLRTEPEFQNHLFLPTITLAPYQSQLVTVVSSSDASMQAIGDRHQPVPLIELRRIIASRAAGGERGIRLVLTRGSVTTRTDRAETEPDLAAPLSFVERKFLIFREIGPGGCAH